MTDPLCADCGNYPAELGWPSGTARLLLCAECWSRRYDTEATAYYTDNPGIRD